MHSYREDERLRKAERLREREEYLETRRLGNRETGSHVVVYAKPSDRSYSRLGMTASTKVGTATTRNWWKRRIREVFRRNKAEIPGGFDFVVIVKTAPERPTFDELREELVETLNRAAAATESS